MDEVSELEVNRESLKIRSLSAESECGEREIVSETAGEERVDER
jgi:hypothetical protein